MTGLRKIDLNEEIEELEGDIEELREEYADSDSVPDEKEEEFATLQVYRQAIREHIENVGETVTIKRLTFGEREGMADRLAQKARVQRAKLPEGALTIEVVTTAVVEMDTGNSPEEYNDTREAVQDLSMNMGDWLHLVAEP